MAFGVLPPYNPLLVTAAFFNALTQMDYARVNFDESYMQSSPYSLAKMAISTDHSEPLCTNSFTILGSAANNQITIPAVVASDYLHAIRAFQGIIYAYEWPFTRDNCHELLQDDEHNLLTLFFGTMFEIPHSQQCLTRMGLSHSCAKHNILWQEMATGELHPFIQKINYTLGEIIREDCRKGHTGIIANQSYIPLLAAFEKAFVTGEASAK